jgi:hypothetical protein
MTLIPTTVTFHGLPHSDALEADIRQRAAGLDAFYRDIMSCRVLVELQHGHRRRAHFHVRVEVGVPGGKPIIVNHEPSLHGPMKALEEPAYRKGNEVDGAHSDAHVAVRDAFDTARRRLQDFAREQRGAVKTHAGPAAETVH